MTLPACYWKWYENFQSTTDNIEVTQNLLSSNAKVLKLDTAKTMLSVGAGYGTLDSFLISKCTSKLEHYIGLDPDKPSIDELSKVMMNFTNLKISLVNESVESWKGPDKPVDLILAIHVFYHIEDKLNAVRKLCTWIKPGGSLVILLGYEHGAYTKLAQDIFKVQHFNIHDLKSLLEEEQYHVYDGGKARVHFPTDTSDEEMMKLNFKYVVQDFTDEQMNTLVTAFKHTYKGSNFETDASVACIRIDKPEA